jgi:hypothetical protein
MKGKTVPWRGRRLAVLIGAALLSWSAPARSQDGAMVTGETPFYAIHAQADPNVIHELAVRLQVLGDEYNERMKGFGGAVRSRLHVYLLDKEEDYVKWGGATDSAATFRSSEKRLVLRAPNPGAISWGFVQEFAFQQFIDAALPSQAAPWTSDGLGSYFGNARWTGDGLVTGIIPAELIRQVQMDQREGKAPPLEKILVPTSGWLGGAGYLERHRKAWAMVQFLAHGDGGKYQQAFAGYVQAVAKGDSVTGAFAKIFGPDAKAFQTRYEQWLASPQAEVTPALQTQATVATLTSFLARGISRKLKFAAAEDFFQAAQDGNVLVEWSKSPVLWLPEGLLKQALDGADKLGAWKLDVKKIPPALVLTEADGTTYTGTFALPDGRRPIVKVERKEPKPAAASRPATPAK